MKLDYATAQAFLPTPNFSLKFINQMLLFLKIDVYIQIESWIVKTT